ncbi:MAG: enoyl-CoA hydratase/isomerase family protein [Alicycliphilus denitrificans]|nr:enoyl-CoA hydratase/isomerase family protein [Alicycliphilus denitrificans]
MDTPYTLIEKSGALATITLNRPQKANALSVAMRASLQERLKEATDDEAIDVVLIQAEGPSFCGGLDLKDLPDDPTGWRDRVLAAQMNHLAVVRCPKVVIAAVQGAVVGGGASLALSADILVMADDAHLSFPFVRLGIVPDGGSSYFLQAKLGVAIAQDLLLTAGKLDAAEAGRLGLTRRIVPAGELRASAHALAEELARLPREARMLTKSLCRQFWARGLEAYLAHEADAFAFAASTPGHRKALEQIKRAPPGA